MLGVKEVISTGVDLPEGEGEAKIVLGLTGDLKEGYSYIRILTQCP